MELFNTTKSLLENLSDISSVFIAFVALIGLYQLVLMKRSTIISSKRDAAKLAFETSNIYDTVFVENVKRIRKVYKDIGVKNFDGKVKTFSIEEYHEYNASWREVFEKNKDKFEEEFREITDKLEAYSVPIIKRISDEDLAFSLDS